MYSYGVRLYTYVRTRVVWRQLGSWYLGTGYLGTIAGRAGEPLGSED